MGSLRGQFTFFPHVRVAEEGWVLAEKSKLSPAETREHS